MEHLTTPLSYELVSTGGTKEISVTPSAAITSAKFVITGVPGNVDDMRTYLTNIYPEISFTLDTDGAGSAVSWDKLHKVVDSVEVISPTLGTVYSHYNTRGAALAHIIGYVSAGYRYCQGARTQIPANTDADYLVTLFYQIPFALDVLADPMETAPWTGFFDSGTVEVNVAATDVFEGDYAGAVIKAPTTIRCTLECVPSSRNFIGVPFQWRRRSEAGGGTSPRLRSVGGETSLNGISKGAGLAGLYWLTDATGIGLGGNDGVDNITALTLDWRGLKNTQNLDPFFMFARAAQGNRGAPISQGVNGALLDTAAWPFAMDSTNEGRPSADPLAYCLPIITPGKNLHTSKVQRIMGDLQVDFQGTVAFTNPHEFLSLELLEFSRPFIENLAKLGRYQGQARRKNLSGKPGTASNFRYTAFDFGA